MTNAEINETIAEHCDWSCDSRGWWSHPTLPDNGGAMFECPDYCHDLNAMHEAEATLRPVRDFSISEQDLLEEAWKPWDTYTRLLADMVGSEDVAFADGKTRAEAFLRTVGKWKEEAHT